MGTIGIDPERLRDQIHFAKRIGVILLKTTPEGPDGHIPMRTEISTCLRAVVGELAEEKIGLAIDNSRIPAQELNEILGSIRSPWLGAALDTANPLALPQGYQLSVRVLGHRALSLQIKDFVGETARYIKLFKPALTIVNSTVGVGTTRAVAERTGAAVVNSPVRGKHAEMAKALLHYAKFVAGTDARAVDAAIEHFNAAGMKTRRVSTPDTLELAKLAETTYFGFCIAFAQELNRYAQAAGADYDEAVRFFEEIEFLPRQTYFPGFIGGHCVIPNIHLLLGVAHRESIP
jgi:hypothetical protein